MAAHRSRAAAAALLVLAAALPAALAQGCAAPLKDAMRACDSQMHAVMMAAAGGSVSAADIQDNGVCCPAVRKVFEAGWMGSCGCDDAVLKITRGATAEALSAMHELAVARCGATAAFPACAARAGGVSPASVGPSGVNPPPGGSGAVCKSDKCKTLCPSKYKGDAAKYADAKAKFELKCMKKKSNGYCNYNATVPQPDIYTEGKGVAVCSFKGNTNTSITINQTVGSETCTACCQPIGDIRKRVRGDIDTYKEPIQVIADKNVCSAAAISGCFPGAATATLADGTTKPLSALVVGDKVLTVAADGSRAFQEVVFFDHELPTGNHAFVRLNLVNGAALELTGGHFVPVGDKLAAAVMTRARDVKAGDAVFVLPAGAAAAEPVLVDSTEAVVREGAFAPVTTGGRIVVDGVVASSYSDWILDPVFDFFGVPEKLPAAMHAVHAPLRWGYAALGPKVLRTLSPIISGIAQLDARQIAAGLRMGSA